MRNRNPHERLTDDIYKELSALYYKVARLRSWEWMEIAECEKKLQKIQSKISNLSYYIGIANQDQKRLLRRNYQQKFHNILNLVKKLDRQLEEKSWLRDGLSRLSGIFKILTPIFGVLGIPITYYLPSSDS